MRILVTTCDAYGHIMPAFARAFVRAWPDNRYPVTVLWAGEDCRPWMEALADLPEPVKDWRLFQMPDMGWSANLIWYLDRTARQESGPFVLLLDDYILDAVNTRLVGLAAHLISHPESPYGMIRLHPVPGPTLPTALPDIGMIDNERPYAISLQPAIWKPEVITDLFRSNEDAWTAEISGSQRAIDYARYDFAATWQSAIGYRGLMRRGGLVDADTQAWIEANL